ncbi:MAG TPA: lipopolysaccharide heptosyltransferase II [Pirellulales bacterium]|nr:lipopolysaccharide heptosyltransferase II [Pirellulales bacterium]
MATASLTAASFRRILLIKPSAVGDIVHALPVLVRLRERYPDAQIDWFVTPENADLVRHHPALSNVVLFDRRRYSRFGRDWFATKGVLGLLGALRRNHYDLVIDLHGQLRSALFTIATGAPVRVGFEKTREGAWLVYSHHIPLLTDAVHAVDRYLWLGRVLGFEPGEPDFTIYLPPASEERIDNLLSSHGVLGRPIALVVPGTVWETKHWRAEGFAGVARHLERRGFAVVLAGAPKDRLRAARVAALSPSACDLTGQTTLAEMMALVRRAGVCITNDSGSMHLAVAFRRPLVSIFGPTSPLLTGPYRRMEAVVQAHVPCSPCLLRKLSHCQHQHDCMQEVTAGMVIHRLETVLARAAA